MNRRDAVSRVALLLGATVIGADFFLSGCKLSHKEEKKKDGTLGFSKDDIAYLDEIAETIIPATDTPGAKAARVGEFMTVMVSDSYDEKNQQSFLAGMKTIEENSRKKFNTGFMKLSDAQRKELLMEADADMKAYMKNKKKEDHQHYFTLMKQLTMLGYFTSEIGMTQAQRYEPIPTRYDGNLPYKKGDKAYSG